MIVGCVSIAAIPPFNGFLGEFLIYLAAFQEAPRFHGWNALPATLTLGSLALTGGLALATFTKLFGTVFLGEPRTDAVINAKDPQGSPRFILLALALLCPAIMLLAPWLVPLAINVAASIFPRANDYSLAIAAYPADAITGIVTVSLILTTATILLLALRQYLYRGRDVATACTWDCGFAGSSPRVQYTGSSFTAPISALFNSLFRVEERVPHIQDLFPESSSYTARTPDVITRHIYQRGFHALERVSSKIIRLQAGRVHLYIAYIVITLLAILAWKLG
jgi:hydrogenase-4 component B